MNYKIMHCMRAQKTGTASKQKTYRLEQHDRLSINVALTQTQMTTLNTARTAAG